MSDELDSTKIPLLCFMAGMFVFFIGLFGVGAGKVWVKNSGWIYRDKEPKYFGFWFAFYFLFGIGLIGYAFYSLS